MVIGDGGIERAHLDPSRCLSEEQHFLPIDIRVQTRAPSGLAQYRERGPKLLAVTFFNVRTACGAILAIDVAFEPRGVRVEIFCRTRSRIAECLPRFAKAGIALRDLKEDGRYEWGTTFNRNADPADVVAGVHGRLDRIESEVAS